MYVARASAIAGVRRLVHISGIGADPGSESPYVRARAIGERLVMEAFPAATILRPSVMFGPEDAFFNQLAALARLMPILYYALCDRRLGRVWAKDGSARARRCFRCARACPLHWKGANSTVNDRHLGNVGSRGSEGSTIIAGPRPRLIYLGDRRNT